MRKSMHISLLAALLLLLNIDAISQVRVRGYYRKDGTYVRPHVRSRPDGNVYNNWSTKGNVNPYTGKEGTKNPDSQSSSSNGQISDNYPAMVGNSSTNVINMPQDIKNGQNKERLEFAVSMVALYEYDTSKAKAGIPTKQLTSVGKFQDVYLVDLIGTYAIVEYNNKLYIAIASDFKPDKTSDLINARKDSLEILEKQKYFENF